MSDQFVTIVKGSFLIVHYGPQDGSGFYTPTTLDRNALVRNLDGTWTEYQGDQFALIYQIPASSSSSSLSSGSGSSISSSSSSASSGSPSESSSSSSSSASFSGS